MPVLSDRDFIRALADEFPEAIPAWENADDPWVFTDGGLAIYAALSDVRNWVAGAALTIEREELPADLKEQWLDWFTWSAFYADQGNEEMQRVYDDRLKEAEANDPRPPPVVTVKEGGEDILRRFWALVERAAEDADHNRKQLLMIELYEGIFWTENIIQYLGPRALNLLAEARETLGDVNAAIGRWPRPDR